MLEQALEEGKFLILSPILSDGRIFSIPIPQNHPSPKKYKDGGQLNLYGISGTELLKEYLPKLNPQIIVIMTRC